MFGFLCFVCEPHTKSPFHWFRPFKLHIANRRRAEKKTHTTGVCGFPTQVFFAPFIINGKKLHAGHAFNDMVEEIDWILGSFNVDYVVIYV